MIDDTRRDTIGHHHDVLDTWVRNGVGPGQWVIAAACRDHSPELFFPIETEKGRWPRYNPNIAKAKAICGGCLVRTECLTHALKWHETGIWGGTTDSEREGLLRRRTT